MSDDHRDEPVLVGKDSLLGYASSDDREGGWTSLEPKTKLKPHGEPRPVASVAKIQAARLSSAQLGLLLISVLLILVLFSSYEIKMLRATVESMAGQLAEMNAALDRSLSSQVKMLAQMEELQASSALSASNFASYQGRFDQEESGMENRSPPSNTTIRSVLSSAFSAARNSYETFERRIKNSLPNSAINRV